MRLSKTKVILSILLFLFLIAGTSTGVYLTLHTTALRQFAAGNLPIVSLTAPANEVTQTGIDSASLIVTRSGGDITQILRVQYAVSGNAQAGQDVETLTQTLTIPKNQTYATIPIKAKKNTGNSDKKSITISLINNPSYVLGNPSTQTLSINPPLPDSSVVSASAGKRSVIVRLRQSANPDTIANTAQVSPEFVYKNAINGFSGEISASQITKLQDNPDVISVEENRIATVQAQSLSLADQRLSLSTNPVANIGSGGAINLDVAVIDTGIDITHPDLTIAGGKACSTGNTSYVDDNGHGTKVAGIIGAKDNDIGVVGVAPGVRLWSVKVADSSGQAPWSDMICGMNFVAQNASTIKVANMSIDGSGTSGTCASSSLHQAACNLVGAGVTLVVAAGNYGDDASKYVPASFPEVITAGAMVDTDGKPGGRGASSSYGPDDSFATFSNYGAPVDISAPGVNVLSTTRGGGYGNGSGTSFSSPIVAGAAALYVATHPGAAPAQVLSGLLAQSALPLPTYPNGFIQNRTATAANLAWLGGSDPNAISSPTPTPSQQATPTLSPTTTPTPSPTATTASISNNGTVSLNGTPRFLYGFYHDGDDPTHQGTFLLNDLTAIAGAGFNLMHPVVTELSDTTQYRQTAPTLGVWTIAQFYQPSLTTTVTALKNDPSIFAWDIGDDFNIPSGDPSKTPSVYETKASQIKAIAPTHLTYGAGTGFPGSSLAAYKNAFDIFGIEAYPVGNKDGSYQTEMEESIEYYLYARQQLPDRTVLALPQTFAWPGGRLPTDAEVRNMTYGALIAHANGILYYSYYCCGTHVPETAMWGELQKLRADIGTFKDALLSGTFSAYDEKPGDRNGSIHAGFWQYNGKTYVVVLNTAMTTKAVSIPLLLGTTGTLSPLFPLDNRYGVGLTNVSNSITGTIGGYEVHAYQIDGNASSSSTNFLLSVFLHGIGHSGDNANETEYALSNQEPLSMNKAFAIEVYDTNPTSGDPVIVATQTGALTYQADTGNYLGTISVNSQLQNKQYTVKIKADKYFKKTVGYPAVIPGTTISLPQVTLSSGDAYEDNNVNIADYNVIYSCYSVTDPARSCTNEQKHQADLNDDGNVNQYDYNLFLREAGNWKGE